MAWKSRRVLPRGLDQLPSVQEINRGLDGALGESGRLGERAQTRDDRLPSAARGLAVEMEVNEVGGRLVIVADDILHEDIEDVIVDGDGFSETRH